MRTETEIRQKLKQVQYRHLKKLLEANFKQRPCNCAYNEVHRPRNAQSGDPIGLCMYSAEHPDDWQGVVCDEDFGGIRQARECGLFKPHKTKLEIKSEFHDLMTNADIGEVAALYPDVAALMWMLDERPYQPTLWQRIKLWWHPEHVIPVEPEGEPDEEADPT